MAGGGKVTVASSATQAASVVAIRADTAPGSNRVFQMWTIRGTGNPLNAGLLQPGAAGGVQVIDAVPGNDVFAVSVEPATGSLQPTNVLAKVQLT
jgi:anti-sigma-K factor RskA